MSARQYYELRIYSFVSSEHRARFDGFLEHAELPAYARLGIEPIGVFTGVYGPDNASLFMLIPHRDLESTVAARERVFEDAAYLDVGRSVLGTDIAHPAYSRVETRLLRAFTGIPELELPTGNRERKGRIFEIRCYESHSRRAAAKKMQMFNEGGEIEIFRKTGLSPVMFGEMIFGPRMPNLTYMLTFDDMAHRDRAWETFKSHPDWIALKSDAQYADTVSTITDVILSPAAYSQM